MGLHGRASSLSVFGGLRRSARNQGHEQSLTQIYIYRIARLSCLRESSLGLPVLFLLRSGLPQRVSESL